MLIPKGFILGTVASFSLIGFLVVSAWKNNSCFLFLKWKPAVHLALLHIFLLLFFFAAAALTFIVALPC